VKVPTEKQKLDQGISDLVGAIFDPLIVWPGGWEDTIPEWLKQSVSLERLIECMKGYKGGEPTGTDVEAMIYMYTASLCHPFPHDWTQIYLYLGRKVYEKWRTPESGATFPEDIRVESLTREQERDLAGLKAWIYRKRVEARLEKDRAARREVRQAKEKVEEERKASQLHLEFDFGGGE
jgi:hypothetical protein